MSLAILLGLLAAFAYGTADFLARLSGRGIGILRTMFFGQAAAVTLLTATLLVSHRTGMPAVHRNTVGWISGGAAAAFIFAATAMLFRGLAHGTVSVVAPVTATYGGVTAMLSILSGEFLDRWSGAALTVVLAGAVIVSLAPRPPTERHQASGLGWAIGAALFYGLGFWIQGAFAVPRLGATTTLWLYYLFGTATLASVAIARRTNLRPPNVKALASAMGIGILSASGYIALLAGFKTGHIAIVTVLSGLASAVTVLLCRFILKEHVGASQWSGIGILLLGLAGLKLKS